MQLMAADYFIIRKGNIHIPSLYQPVKGALYMFTHGFNIRSHVAWTGGMLFGLPGLIAAYQPDAVGISAKRIYTMAWIVTTAATVVLYLAICYFFPVPVFPKAYSDVPVKWEYLGPTHGYFDGEPRRLGATEDLHGEPMTEGSLHKDEAINVVVDNVSTKKFDLEA
jgi:NCS1 family nucleobase:cation symporter-1